MDLRIVWSSRDWAEAAAELPAQGPLPCRTVLVPRERVAHVLRRELIRAGRTDALAGTRFVPAPYAAVEVLRSAGVAFEPGEEGLRAARLVVLFRSELELGHFSSELLRNRPGWDEAFARTISDLEGAGLRPADLGSSRRLRDVAAIWRGLEESAGHSWTTQRIYLEAALALERDAALWPFDGPTLAFAKGDVTAAEARFVRAIPGATLGLLAARPARERHLDRMSALLGPPAAEALRTSSVARPAGKERDLLAGFLFEPPSVLTGESRPRSDGPDGTVELEEHAGLEAEVEATATWVARQVADATPLEEIAVLVPALDPLAGLVSERLARLPWQGGAMPVHVAGGLALTSFAAGARAMAVVRALRAHLAARSLAEVLPTLRLSAPGARHLSRGAAMDLVWSLGTVGGNPARPEGALDWTRRAREREAELPAELDRARAAEAEGSGAGRWARDIERMLDDLRAARPALDALVELARHTIGGSTLAVLWPALHGFLADWLLQPGEGPRVHALLDERLGALASDAACGSLAGDDALRVIEETIAVARVRSGRFGEPAVYVGTLREAVGLRFRAVRVIDLVEGHLPSLSREDPVVPDMVRESLRTPGATAVAARPRMAADRALADLHALDIAVRNAEERIALSAARLDAERSQREPSSVMLEAAAALARPDRSTGERSASIPDVAALRRDGFAPAREASSRFRRERPLGDAAWQDGVSLRALGVPPRWRGTRALDLDRVVQLGAPFGAMDGWLGSAGAAVRVPGLTAERPISPSAVQRLLECPHEFLLADVLGFKEPASPPSQREIGQPAYGSLFHAVAAEFYERHGAPFCAREGTLAGWQRRADEIVERRFGAFLKEYPLVGEAVRAQQRERLQRDVHELLEYDWQEGTTGRRFVAVERSFGRPTPVRLPLGAHALFLSGRIDRLDVEKGRALVRDLKTGRAYPRVGKEEKPQPVRDVQLALYGLVAKAHAEQWGIPKDVAAAYAYFGRGHDERSYCDDFHETLEPQARRWLDLVAGLLDERLFPRTPTAKDCTYCRFRPVCGEGVHERAAELLVGGVGVLAGFAALKGMGPGEDDEVRRV